MQVVRYVNSPNLYCSNCNIQHNESLYLYPSSVRPDIIRNTIWMYFTFNLNFRDVEEPMIEHGVDMSHATIRRWVDKFGSAYSKRIKSRFDGNPPFCIWMGSTPKKTEKWFAFSGPLITKLQSWISQSKHERTPKPPCALLRKRLRNQGVKPTQILADRLGSCGGALKQLGMKYLQDVGGRKNNRADCSHVPIGRRERKLHRFRSIKGAQNQLSAQIQIYNRFNHRCHLISRSTLRKYRHQANTEWNLATALFCA